MRRRTVASRHGTVRSARPDVATPHQDGPAAAPRYCGAHKLPDARQGVSCRQAAEGIHAWPRPKKRAPCAW